MPRSALLFNYNLQASRDSQCPNLALHGLSERPAQLYGVFKCSTHKFADVIRAAGGIQILFPLFLQLDFAGADGSWSSLAVPLLQALKALLLGNPRNQADFLRQYMRRSRAPTRTSCRVGPCGSVELTAG